MRVLSLVLGLTLGTCAARPPLPSLVLGLRSTRVLDGNAPSADHAVSVGLVATERPPMPIAATTPPPATRSSTTPCHDGWLCAWERTRVAEATAQVVGGLR